MLFQTTRETTSRVVQRLTHLNANSPLALDLAVNSIPYHGWYTDVDKTRYWNAEAKRYLRRALAGPQYGLIIVLCPTIPH